MAAERLARPGRCPAAPPGGERVAGGESFSCAGTIVAVLPHETYVVALAEGATVRAHLAGEMRQRAVRLSLGDRVAVTLTEYDRSRGRIIHRLP